RRGGERGGALARRGGAGPSRPGRGARGRGRSGGGSPPYRQLLPEDYESRLTVSRQQLQDAVRRVGLLARENSPVKLEFNALGVRLSSSSPDLGGAVEVVEAQYEGEDLVAAFNPTYLSDGLNAASGDRVAA